MFVKINSGGIRGIYGCIVGVEADAGSGLPGFTMVGYLAPEVKEAQDRVRTALKNTGFRLPAKKVTVSLSPGNIRKEGTFYDLPIAVAVLGAYGLVPTECLRNSMVAGELGLDGRVKPVRGILSLVMAAREQGFESCYVPRENVKEGQAVSQIQIIGVDSLAHMVSMLENPVSACPAPREEAAQRQPLYEVDFKEVNGQQCLRRGAEIAAAGMHNFLMGGPAGTGKTMVARRIPTILPPLSWEERIEISRIYSICGLLPKEEPLLFERPFRSPHHTVTLQALTGGGRPVRPGEFSLASYGVLFMDEFTLFSRAAIELLRQPLEERRIVVTRLYGTYEFPADFMLCAAMNPCPCGYYPDRNRCSCTETQIRQYLSRLSRPIIQRFDLCLEAAPVSYQEVMSSQEDNEDSQTIARRVKAAWEIQSRRFKGTSLRFNSQMGGQDVKKYCLLEAEERSFLERLYQVRGLSPRTLHKVLKTARTIADLEQRPRILRRHLSEAAEYRGLEERLWPM